MDVGMEPPLRYRVLFCGLLSAVGSCTYAAYAVAQGATPPQPDVVALPPEMMTQTHYLAAMLVGLLSLVATNVFQMISESRKRKWDLADRALAREKSESQAQHYHADLSARQEVIRIENIQTAVELAKVLKSSREKLIAEILNNTNITKEAREHITKLLLNGRPPDPARPTLADIAAVGEDTNIKVTKLVDENEKGDA